MILVTATTKQTKLKSMATMTASAPEPPIVHSASNCYTRIHGHWYDLASFASRHPGGAAALRLAAGRDSTIMFESHHVFSSRQVLDKYLDALRVTDPALLARLHPLDEIAPSHGEDPPFDWPSGGTPFRNEVVTRVRAHFAAIAKARGVSLREATKATSFRIVEVTVLVVIALCALYSGLRGNILVGALVFPVAAWLAGVNIFHDASHFALSTNPRVNNIAYHMFPYFSSPLAWTHQHIIGHHAYTNLPNRDPDLWHSPSVRREHPSHEWTPAHETQWHPFRIGFNFAVATWLGMMLNDLAMTFSPRGLYNNVVPRIPSSIISRAVHVLVVVSTSTLAFAWPFVWVQHVPIIYRLALSVLPNVIFSALFMLNTQLSHLTVTLQTSPHRDWYIHQVLASQNYGPTKPWWMAHASFICSGGLGLQIEHHLFPTVNHCHLRDLTPIVKDVCKRHGVAYTQLGGYQEGMAHYFRHSWQLGARVKGSEALVIPDSDVGPMPGGVVGGGVPTGC